MSRQHSQSNLVKPSEGSKPESQTLRRKYSEQLLIPIPNPNKASSYSGEETVMDNNSSVMTNYKRKYFTKVEEHEDYILIGDKKLQKPFVEKPLDAEDHQINIYYPRSDGGGCKSLFRKTDNVSSSFDPEQNQIRTGGSFIYENFLPTEGFDIKVRLKSLKEYNF